jgi:Protein of unknown function (DUF1696).
MIDFQNANFFKLRSVANSTFESKLIPMFAHNEEIIGSYQSVRDGVVFTNKRIIAINIQGVGVKKDYTSLPYTQIKAFSVETAGMFDLDSELQLWFAGLGTVKFEFLGTSNVTTICRVISEYALI